MRRTTRVPAVHATTSTNALKGRGGFREDIFAFVAAIPKGKVSTYGSVAAAAGYPGAARAVGNALHANTSPETVPCHRVVHADGRLGENYGFGGPEAQKERLMAEGVRFNGEVVDMDSCLYITIGARNQIR